MKSKPSDVISQIILFQCMYVISLIRNTVAQLATFLVSISLFILIQQNIYTCPFLSDSTITVAIPAFLNILLALDIFTALKSTEFYRYLYRKLTFAYSIVLKGHNGRNDIFLPCCWDYNVTIIILIQQVLSKYLISK